MVFEQIIKAKWIKRKEHSFFLGFFYSLLGLMSAKLIFSKSLGLMSVAFTSILLVPSLNVLLNVEENEEVKERRISLKRLWQHHNDILKVYIFMFLGIFLAYGIFAVLFDTQTVTSWFAPQLNTAGISGKATGYTPKTLEIVQNNLMVFIVCFILSLVYGAGSIVFLAWNASVWGVVFGFFAKVSSYRVGLNPFNVFFVNLFPFLPHMITEAVAYVGAAIVGGIVSKAIIREKFGSKRFKHVMKDAVIVLVLGIVLVALAGLVETYFYGRFA